MILVLGSLNVDLVADMDRLPKPGETVAGLRFSNVAGGKGANQALAARRAGAVTRMIGAVGPDELSETAVHFLRQDGVNIDLVRVASVPTGTAVVMVDGKGENQIAVIPGANGTLTYQDATEAVETARSGDILLLQLETPPQVVEYAIALARRRGVTTVLNLAPLGPNAAMVAQNADIVIANAVEFSALAEHHGLSLLDVKASLFKIHEETGQTVIVTLGANGVMAIRESIIYSEAGLVIEPVDTVGAGDTFCGYLAACLDQGKDFKTALKLSAIAGSLACLQSGAQPSIPYFDEVAARAVPPKED